MNKEMIKRLLESLDDDTEISFIKLHNRYFIKVIKWVKDIPYSKQVIVPEENFIFIDEIMKELGVEILGEDNEAIPIEWIESYIQTFLPNRTIGYIRKMIENWREENESTNNN